MLAVSLFVILCGRLNSASSSCPSKCSCPHDVPRCSRGVGLVLDSCGCCRVCARQLNEDCSRDEPCDHTKGLECNHGAGYGKAKGICRAKSDGRPCEFNSNMYQNGESFSPNCKHQCTCMDGAVGCVPLCPQELSLPNAGCAKPILFKVPGRCCEDLVCPGEGVSVGSAIKKGSEDGLRDKPSEDDLRDKPSEDDLTTRNKLVSVVRGGLISLPAFKNQPETLQSSKGKRCVAQSSAWSPCSRSCGTGVSLRVTNNNSQCKLVKETRLCQVRPCSQSPFSSLKKGKKCSHTKRARQPVRLTYAGCRSIKSFRPRYCGSCLDGRCCRPQQTQTVAVCFRCEGGETLSQDVMMIQSCTCDFNCNDKPLAFHRRSNDIHKSKD